MFSNSFTHLFLKMKIMFLILATGCLNSYSYSIYFNFKGKVNNVILIWLDWRVCELNRATKFVRTNFTSSWIKKSEQALTFTAFVRLANKTRLAYNFTILSWVVCDLMNMPHGRLLPGLRNVKQILLTRRDREIRLPLCCFTSKWWQFKTLLQLCEVEIDRTSSKLNLFCATLKQTRWHRKIYNLQLNTIIIHSIIRSNYSCGPKCF
jgi:hypothetical protein